MQLVTSGPPSSEKMLHSLKLVATEKLFEDQVNIIGNTL